MCENCLIRHIICGPIAEPNRKFDFRSWAICSNADMTVHFSWVSKDWIYVYNDSIGMFASFCFVSKRILFERSGMRTEPGNGPSSYTNSSNCAWLVVTFSCYSNDTKKAFYCGVATFFECFDNVTATTTEPLNTMCRSRQCSIQESL